MKTGIFIFALAGIALVQAVAIPEPLKFGNQNFCHHAGQPCTKLRRAVEVAAEAVDVPNEAIHVKRAALALAEAAGNALNAYDSSADSCYATNGSCNGAIREEIKSEAGDVELDRRDPRGK